MKEIILTKGKVALVDDADYEYLNQWKWSYHCRGYAVRQVQQDRLTKNIFMHALIMGQKGIDHIDGNKLNNQRHNLRYATGSQNQWNKSAYKNNTSGTKGVCWNKANNSWVARINVHGKTYQKASKDKTVVEQWARAKREQLHGEYARH
jgi:hypothetical protein